MFQNQFNLLEDLSLENQYGSCIVTNILRQLLCYSPGLQSMSLMLVDCLDDVVWSQIISTNSLTSLISLTLDQCHSISGDCLYDLISSDNSLQVVNFWSCRFITAKHREQFKV